jgi:hypothetical protein
MRLDNRIFRYLAVVAPPILNLGVRIHGEIEVDPAHLRQLNHFYCACVRHIDDHGPAMRGILSFWTTASPPKPALGRNLGIDVSNGIWR